MGQFGCKGQKNSPKFHQKGETVEGIQGVCTGIKSKNR
jgi:hypothetical protein